MLSLCVNVPACVSEHANVRLQTPRRGRPPLDGTSRPDVERANLSHSI